VNEIVVMSGKGGTGKTSIAAALGVLAGRNAVMADCDVDAANMHLLYTPEVARANEFWSGKTAVIDTGACAACGVCEQQCRFGAIAERDGAFHVDDVVCEGCSLCHHLCPENAIVMKDEHAGDWFVSKTRFDGWFVHARLGIGQENSGKLVTRVKRAAKDLAAAEGIPYVIVDGPPGIGCPAIASVSGADHVLIVTEATMSGLHDLERLIDLVEYFKTSASCVVNKFEVNPDVGRCIVDMCRRRDVDVVTTIPYDRVFNDALRDGKTLVETNNTVIAGKIGEIWEHLRSEGGTT
jgi:MinD superfamily P-loop ATPase